MSFDKRVLAALAAIFLILSLSVQPIYGRHNDARGIYHQAWELVKDNYYDPTFNGHDWNDLEHKYDSQIKDVNDSYRSIKLMLDSLNDPYTRLLDPKAFQDENDAIDAHIVGIGVNLQQSKDQAHLIVTRTIEGGPAEKAGITSGDEIVTIDGTVALGITPEQAAEHIRGKLGTPVQLGVKHAGNSKVLKITRQEIEIKAVAGQDA